MATGTGTSIISADFSGAFGYGDATAASGIARAVQIAAHGGVAVFGISLFHLQQVTPLYAALTNGDVMLAVMMTEIFPLFIMPVAALYLIAAIRDAGLRHRLIELALLCLLLSVVPPLVGFANVFLCDSYWPTYASYLGSCQLARDAAAYFIASGVVHFGKLGWRCYHAGVA